MFSPTVSRELLELGLIDEIDLHVAPVLLGEGIRPCDNPGSEPIRLHRVGEGYPGDRVGYDSSEDQRSAGTQAHGLPGGHRGSGPVVW